ncbi:hypothetical protein BaRGS_00034480 [Batillaria attramentaria]|uniref:Uncharacterized protein n=1 Tax=Batillaria attramentaria TaxID=370345 RepID=A0ABD0JHV4_9CAEN
MSRRGCQMASRSVQLVTAGVGWRYRALPAGPPARQAQLPTPPSYRPRLYRQPVYHPVMKSNHGARPAVNELTHLTLGGEERGPFQSHLGTLALILPLWLVAVGRGNVITGRAWTGPGGAPGWQTRRCEQGVT